MLFNIFLDDIVDDLVHCNTDSINMNSKHSNCLLYADDMLLLSKTCTGLQTAINCLTKFYQEWGLSINCKKTKVVIFQRYGKTPNNLEFFPDKDKINIVQEYTYLGLTFTRTGSLKMAAKCLAQKATKALLNLNKTLYSSKVTETRINIKLYESVIKPIATYGCAV